MPGSPVDFVTGAQKTQIYQPDCTYWGWWDSPKEKKECHLEGGRCLIAKREKRPLQGLSAHRMEWQNLQWNLWNVFLFNILGQSLNLLTLEWAVTDSSLQWWLRDWISLRTFHLGRFAGLTWAWDSPNLFPLPGTKLTDISHLSPQWHTDTWLSPSAWNVRWKWCLPLSMCNLPCSFSVYQPNTNAHNSLTVQELKTVEPQNETILVLLGGKIPAALIHTFWTLRDKEINFYKVLPIIHFGGIHMTLINIAAEAPILTTAFI